MVVEGDIMEYPSRNDFFLIFKPIYSSHGLFLDYLLLSTSKNFYDATNLKVDNMIGERVSKIISEYNILGLKSLYDNMVPNTIRKLEVEIEDLDRKYMVNLLSDERDYLILFYNEINSTNNYKNDVYDNREVSRIYYKDGLTGLYNRAFFNEELFRLNTERQLPLSIIMGDLNGLKLINDAFGHEMGDKALIRVAEVMRKTFRKEDIISRIGGDEFAILLPNTTEEIALEIVERIKDECVKSPLDFLILSISFGVGTKVDKDQDINAVMQKADNRMYYMKIKEGKKARHDLINNLRRRLEETSFETKAHNKRLENLSMLLADNLDLSDKDKEELKLLCEYHDIGKIGIPEHILLKEEPLDKNEWEDLKRHSEIGYHIFKDLKKDMSVNDLILIHHERWDGNGYPGFLKNEEIPLVVRIFSIVDAYEAMVNDRPYKAKISHSEAIKEIMEKAGSQFDPMLAEKFIELMGNNNIN